MKPRVDPVARCSRPRPVPRRRENEAARVTVIVVLSVLAAGAGSGLAALSAWWLGFGRDEIGVAGFVLLFWTAAYLSFRGR